MKPPRFAVFADQPEKLCGTSAEEKEFMVDGLLAKLYMELCLQFVLHLSRQVSPVLSCTGFHL